MKVEVMDDDDLEYSYDDEITLYLKAIKHNIRYCLEKFFSGKRFHSGGPLPMSEILSDITVDFVGRMGLCQGLHLIGTLLETVDPGIIEEDNVEVSWDIYKVSSLISECHLKGVPSNYQAGTILLYLKFCMGIQIPSYEACLCHILPKSEKEEVVEEDDQDT